LERSIEKNSPLTRISKTKIQDFSKLLKAVSDNKPLPVNIDLTKLEKAVVNIEQYINDQSQPSDQGAENYQPVRRVIKVGNRFIFDDNFSNAGGGGGSSGGGTTDGLTDAQLRASPVPVSASIDTTGLATSAKQDTQTALLTTIDTDTGNIATEVAGLLTDTELRATPVPVSGTVTATPTGTQNVDVTANTIGLATSANQTNGNQIAVAKGDVASGSADSGNPVKVGAKYNSTQPTFTDGQRADMQVDSRGNLRMGLYANNTQTTASFKADNADADATSATANKLGVMSRGTVYNGTTWDRMKGDATDGLLVNLGSNNDVSLNAGTNAIGKLSANSGVDIGDVDVTSTTFPTPVATSTYSPTRFVDFGSNATANIKSSAGNVFSLYCNNENSSDRYIQLHNTATTPAGGATPLYSFRVPGSGDILVGTYFFTNAGANFTTGIAFAFSTTKDTYTAGTATEQSTTVHYK
jgi:hypothetical protein